MKTYRKPKAKIVNIKGQVILAGSENIDKDTNGISGEEVGSKRGLFDYEM